MVFRLTNVRERIRTPDTLVRSQVLYPAELLTHVLPQTGIEPVRCRHHRILSPARLPVPPLRHRHIYLTMTFITKWDLQGSNLWPPACKADALPAELRSHSFSNIKFERPERGSNPRPPPWQGGALTNWATGPCIIFRFEWTFRDSNPGPIGYEPIALTNWAKGPCKSRWTDSNR